MVSGELSLSKGYYRAASSKREENASRADGQRSTHSDGVGSQRGSALVQIWHSTGTTMSKPKARASQSQSTGVYKQDSIRVWARLVKLIYTRKLIVVVRM